MKYKGFIATDLDNLQFRSEVPDNVGTWTFREFNSLENITLFEALNMCNQHDLKLLLESIWDNKDLWVTENLNLMNFGANQVLEAITPYGYDFQRKVGKIYTEKEPENKSNLLDYVEVKKQIFYQPVDSEGTPLKEELILECIFEQFFVN